MVVIVCKSCSVSILNGRFGHDNGIGKYTFHSKQGSSVVDYMAMSSCLLNYVVDFQVIDVVSDHNMLSCQLRVGQVNQIRNNSSCRVTKCRWNPELSERFLSGLESISGDINLIVDEILSFESQDMINQGVKRFTYTINNIAAPLFHKSYTMCNDGRHNKTTILPWTRAFGSR